MNSEIIDQVHEYVHETFLNHESSALYPYHNWDHTCNVVEATRLIATGMNFSDTENQVLVLAAYFHDTGHLEGPSNHEERSAEIAESFLKKKEQGAEIIANVRRLILATAISAIPELADEKVIRDADLSHFGQSGFLEFNQMLFVEYKKDNKNKISTSEWYKNSYDFISNHNYYTEQAKNLYNSAKLENLKTIKAMISENTDEQGNKNEISVNNEKKEKKEKKKQKSLVAKSQSSRGVETIFRVSLRNHLNLSSIADSKANTLISVNAIIISIVLSALFPKLDSNPYLIYPGIALITFSLITIVIAIFSTMPKTTHGKLTREMIKEKKGNLLFFGNFHSMSLDDFEWGISELMNDSTYLYSNLTRDLYFLGKVLNRKYMLLRYSYISFILGLVLSIALFLFSLRSEEFVDNIVQ